MYNTVLGLGIQLFNQYTTNKQPEYQKHCSVCMLYYCICSDHL